MTNRLLAASLLFVLPVPVANAQSTAPGGQQANSGTVNEWTTWGFDPERSGWNRAERTLSRENVSRLKVKWRAKLPTPVRDVVLSTLTAPVIAKAVTTPTGPRDLLYVLGADDVVSALDADTGKPVWSKRFGNPLQPGKPPTWLCPNTANATPVIDKARGLLFVLPSDGKLRALRLADGDEAMAATQFVTPFARAWSLNLIGDIVYTTSGRACGQVFDQHSVIAAAVARPPLRDTASGTPAIISDPSAVHAIDVRDLKTPAVSHFFTSGGRPAGAWGRGALARGPDDSVILETSDGLYDPGSGNWGDTILKLSPRVARVLDSFTPENHQQIAAKDLGGSASPTVFTFGNRTLVAVSQKESVLYILDAKNMGGGGAANHASPVYRSPQLGNDLKAGTDPSHGVWGAISTYESPDGRRFIYVPVWGPPSVQAPTFKLASGEAPNGSIMAFEIVAKGDGIDLVPQWRSGDMVMPDPPTIANGVVFALSTGGQVWQNIVGGVRVGNSTPESAKARATPIDNMELHAFDAVTGERLFSSGDTLKGWVHFSEPVVADGKIFLVTFDGEVIAMGVD